MDQNIQHTSHIIPQSRKIGGQLGEGGMGIVYMARDTKLDREVAIKVIHAAAGMGPEARERFATEARAAGLRYSACPPCPSPRSAPAALQVAPWVPSMARSAVLRAYEARAAAGQRSPSLTSQRLGAAGIPLLEAGPTGR